MLLPVSFHGFFLRAFFFKGFFQGIQAKGKGIGKIFDVYPCPYLQQLRLKRKVRQKFILCAAFLSCKRKDTTRIQKPTKDTGFAKSMRSKGYKLRIGYAQQIFLLSFPFFLRICFCMRVVSFLLQGIIKIKDFNKFLSFRLVWYPKLFPFTVIFSVKKVPRRFYP